MAAGAALTMASCSSSEEPMPEQLSDITIAVNAPVASLTRAAVELPEGYTMKCVLQLLDATNANVGTQTTADIDVATGKGSFVISADAQANGATKAIFWADYRDKDGKSVYNTVDLKAVGYSTVSFDLSDNAAMAATDAFCGKLETIKDGASVTLLRPFANINFTPSNPEKVSEAKKMIVTYNAPAAFSVLSGTAADNAALEFTNNSFDAKSTPWFSTFIFASSDQTTLNSAITIDLSEGVDKQIKIPAGKVPLNENYQINISAEIGDENLEDITVNFEINTGFDKPEAPKMEVGSYVNASGEAVASAEEAVGIVFHLDAMEGDEASLYGDKFAGKTIKGYAVALNNVIKGRQVLNTEPTGALTETSWVNGAEGTESFLNDFKGSAFATTYTEWVNANPLNSNNVSGWYIPSLNQLSSWIGMIYPDTNGNAATGSDAFKALFPDDAMFDRDPFATVYYASCSINSNGNVSGVRLNVTDDELDNAGAAQMTTATKANQSAICRPMFTIFE